MRRLIGATIVAFGLLMVGGALFGAGWEARGGDSSPEKATVDCMDAFEDLREAAQKPGITEAQLDLLASFLRNCDR